jgi:hypothetical protein
MEPDRAFTQRELARTAGLNEGFTSRIVRDLEQQQLVVRKPDGAVQLSDFDTMLDAWRESYDFSKHHIVRGHIPSRSGDDLLRKLSANLVKEQVRHAATGLAGAWLINPFAAFRLVVCYVDRLPSAETKTELAFHEEEHGENVWLVVPNDEGVFHGSAEHDHIWCVHPIQAYLDLKQHPERSEEAAAQLRSENSQKGEPCLKSLGPLPGTSPIKLIG